MRSVVAPMISSFTTWTRRDLPIPASPLSTTMWPRPAWTCAQRSRSNAHFVLASHQRREAAGRRDVEALLHLSRTPDLIDLEGRGHAFERLGPKHCGR